MNELLDLILTPLQAELSGQVRQRFKSCQSDPDAQGDGLSALREALQDLSDGFPPAWWLDSDHCCWWLCLHVDWKAYDEVAWQVQAICRTLGLAHKSGFEAEAQWNGYFEKLDRLRSRHSDSGSASHSSLVGGLRARLGRIGNAGRRQGPVVPPKPSPPPGTPTLDVMQDASEWLQHQGYDLLYFETGGDDYLAVPVRLDLLAQATAAAERLDSSTFLV